MMNSRADKIKSIVIHCSAGYGDVEAIKNFWKYTLGWKSPGYHRIIDLDGKIHKLSDFENITNGVRGFNTSTLHICYIGGVDKNNYSQAKDTRIFEQKESIIECIYEALEWLESKGRDVCEIEIKGHRDFSPDLNGNGVIDPWERIKECPSFDAIPEYLSTIDEYVINK